MSVSPGGSGDTPPLFFLVELLARRHALPLLWQLRGGPQPFRVLARACGAPDPVASQRLRELREAGLVEVSESGEYRMTGLGRRLQGALDGLEAFAGAWASVSPRTRTPRGALDKADDEP